LGFLIYILLLTADLLFSPEGFLGNASFIGRVGLHLFRSPLPQVINNQKY
jgi:hypothetical protein